MLLLLASFITECITVERIVHETLYGNLKQTLDLLKATKPSQQKISFDNRNGITVDDIN
jgi:hypothetical protein